MLQEVQMAASLSATFLIQLRPFAKEFDTGFGLGGEEIAAYGITNASRNAALKSSGSRGLGSRIAGSLGFSGGGGSMGNSGLRSRNEKPVSGGDVNLEDMRNRRDMETPKEASESVRGLTEDVIVQTIDYRVDYEEDGERRPSDSGWSNRWHDRTFAHATSK